MAEKPTNTIRIHPAGTRTTDGGKPTILAALAPVAFRKAQDVMVAATKYNNKSCFFSSERSRTQKFQTECYELAPKGPEGWRVRLHRVLLLILGYISELTEGIRSPLGLSHSFSEIWLYAAIQPMPNFCSPSDVAR